MVKRFMAPGPWITRDLKECVLASDYDALAAEVAALRSRLAEAEALLREARDTLCSRCTSTDDYGIAVVGRIDARLSRKEGET